MLLENKRIALLCMLPYPFDGEASTIRIHSYCKALVCHGNYVKVFILTPLTQNNTNVASGVFEGVEFEYLYGLKWNTHTSKIAKYFIYIRSLFKITQILYKKKMDVIFSYHTELFFDLIFFLYRKINFVPVVLDETEYPFHYKTMSKISRFIIRRRLSLYSGIITISKELESFYSMINKHVFLLPMSIDPFHFTNIKREEKKKSYIAVVFGTHNRDNIIGSLFSYIEYLKKTDSPWELWLVGDYEKLCQKHPECNKIRDIIKENEIDDKVRIVGRKTNSEVRQILVNADCLLTTPLRYTSGGFPTKLGEYMLSGVPIVATSTGEIPLFLEHDKDIFLVEPGNPNEISNWILYVQYNKEKSKIIAENALSKAKKVFNANTYIPELLKFVDDVQDV